MIKVFKAIRGYLCVALLVILLVPLNLAQMASIFVLPINKRWFMRYNMFLKQTYCGFVARVAKFCGNRLVQTGDKPRPENTLVFANHQSMIDIVFIWIWCMEPKTIGWIKWFAKDALKYIPGMGWGMMFVNTLFVKRDWAKDADSVKATFSKIRKGNLPTWLVIFPEGTRLKPDKVASSKAYAARKGLPVFENVMLPRGKGIHASIQGLANYLVSVYDVTIQYDGPIPSLMDFFSVGGYTARLHAVRYEISAVPERERDLNTWLLGRFIEKDKLMAQGLKNSNLE